MPLSFEDVMRVATTVSTLCMCISPLSTIIRFHLRRNVGDAAVLPYVTLWVSSHMWMLYGYVIGNIFPVFVTYAIGDTLSVVFLAVYIRWTANRRAAIKTCAIALLWIVAVTTYVVLCKTEVLQQSQQTLSLVMGIIGTSCSLVLYASPLAAIKVVLQTRSSASLPFALILAGTINNLMWVVYGATVPDLFMVIPSAVSAGIGFIQLALCGVFHPSRSAAGDIVTSVLPCESPNGELPKCRYSIMESATPLPVTYKRQEKMEVAV
ncbi:unnamed protein product [Hyaloperonospora brassicae]|uniref:Sugar transporter SWEET1 n=1 Tax=Hyaloperonospora brassicae TaxID=162125 RepID=A0AAV0TPT7_HYABA|nr:unnamed protein product [Hyaloperonospora brassicae]